MKHGNVEARPGVGGDNDVRVGGCAHMVMVSTSAATFASSLVP